MHLTILLKTKQMYMRGTNSNWLYTDENSPECIWTQTCILRFFAWGGPFASSAHKRQPGFGKSEKSSDAATYSCWTPVCVAEPHHWAGAHWPKSLRTSAPSLSIFSALKAVVIQKLCLKRWTLGHVASLGRWCQPLAHPHSEPIDITTLSVLLKKTGLTVAFIF